MQRTRLKNTASKTYAINPRSALRYTVEFVLLILFFSAGKAGYALALGLYCGLIYARQNLLIVSPLFVVAGCVFLSSWWTLIFLFAPPIAFAVLYFVFHRMKRNVPLWVVVLFSFVSALAFGIFNLLSYGDGLSLALSVVVAVVFAFCCTTGGYAVLIRGIKCRFTLDETICLCVFAVAFAYATYGVEVYGFRMFYLVFAFLILSFSVSGKHGATLVLSLLFALGAVLKSFDFSLAGVCVILGFASTILCSFSRFASVLAMVALSVVFWLLGVVGGYESAILIFVGGMMYSLLPREMRSKFSRPSRDKADTLCAMVNRDRMAVAGRLSSVSDVFLDLSDQLDKEDENNNPYTAGRLAKEVAKNYCGRCPERNKCFSALGGDTSEVLLPLAEAVMSRGKTTILDVPNFLSSRCVKVHNLLSVVNNAGEAYKTKSALGREIFNCKKVMAEQFAGMSLILDSLAQEYSKNITFGGDDEERLENELMKHNIVASETVIAGKGASSRVALTVRDVDVGKTMLVKTVSQCLKNPYAIDKVTDRGEEKTVHFVTAPTFDVAYGVAEKRRDGQLVSGDSKAVLSPSLNKKIFALADGMGSGQKASLVSMRSLNMIENFYRAGFEDGLILSLVNQLLCLVGDDDFSALDIAVIDTADGGLDVIKLGATSGFILRKDAVEVLKSNAPPVGIVDKINPTTARHQLYDGDMVILASDGVVDTLGESGVIDVVSEANTSNPQTLADRILLTALGAGAEDDCTVMVMRLAAI